MTAMLAALQSTFDGTSIGEFVNWLNRIVDRRGIADYWRGKEREPETAPIADERSTRKRPGARRSPSRTRPAPSTYSQ